MWKMSLASPARTIAVADARMRLLLLKPIEIAKISNKTQNAARFLAINQRCFTWISQKISGYLR